MTGIIVAWLCYFRHCIVSLEMLELRGRRSQSWCEKNVLFGDV